MKVYKVTLCVIDHDGLGEGGIKQNLECVRFPNDRMSPDVVAIESRDIGEWRDSHPLNCRDRLKREFAKLFARAHNEAQ
jgi:hypothetical protein